MMTLYENKMYMEDIHFVCNQILPWEKFHNKSILISGATGLIGSFFIDVILEKNRIDKLNCTVYALVRNEDRAKKRFKKFLDGKNLIFIQCDIKEPIKLNDVGVVDFVLHLASNTHPILYATDPIGTIITNVIGLHNLLEFAVKHSTSCFAFASSNEIYGENRGDVEFFDESYCGYIDCNTLRAAYPESKRCGEALCQAYLTQHKLHIVIPRITRSYGPTMNLVDSKAISQFIKNGLDGKNIILKSNGMQYYSYTYVADAVAGLLYVLLLGKIGESYNIADVNGDIMLKDLAKTIAELNGRSVIFEHPDAIESMGYSKATRARLSGEKLKKLGWIPKYDIKSGVERTMAILRTLQ